ncbi:MAG TPA: flagellar hook capping FlgD N-terminal domain-containing protein [Ignavibacteriaceae bacterium]|nr:flagellar hook capping FlgD N-terminal domain-containing protein [Ignavibacteriaceae bacterium]
MISSVNTTTNNTQPTSSSTSSTTASNTLDKNSFMKLLIAQMQNQDPMSPMDGTQFAAQLAQFSSLEQLQNLNTSMTTSINANYALTQSINNTLSSTLIGKNVKLGGGSFQNNGQGSIDLGYTLPSNASSVSISVLDSNGNVVKTLNNLPTASGDNKLSWDFSDNNGNTLPQGSYTYTVNATGSDGSTMTATPFIEGTISGVQFGANGASLMVGNSQYQLSDVMEIFN